VLLAYEMELHREPILNAKSRVSLMDRELRRRCFWACFVLDRFLAAGSLRPMLIRDNDIKLRIPSTNASFVAGEPIEGPFFSPDTFSASTPSIGYIAAETAFIGIISILGRAISYLQRGGVKGDTHFPWHSNSKLASLRGELATWCSSAPQMFQDPLSTTGSDGPMRLLTITCYHLIHCLIFRDFLPVDAQQELASASATAVHRTWQAETTDACLSSANEVVNAVQASSNAEVVYPPPFIGYVSV
jgi:Fungal specific transcription factor domain